MELSGNIGFSNGLRHSLPLKPSKPKKLKAEIDRKKPTKSRNSQKVKRFKKIHRSSFQNSDTKGKKKRIVEQHKSRNQNSRNIDTSQRFENRSWRPPNGGGSLNLDNVKTVSNESSALASLAFPIAIQFKNNPKQQDYYRRYRALRKPKFERDTLKLPADFPGFADDPFRGEVVQSVSVNEQREAHIMSYTTVFAGVIPFTVVLTLISVCLIMYLCKRRKKGDGNSQVSTSTSLKISKSVQAGDKDFFPFESFEILPKKADTSEREDGQEIIDQMEDHGKIQGVLEKGNTGEQGDLWENDQVWTKKNAWNTEDAWKSESSWKKKIEQPSSVSLWPQTDSSLHPASPSSSSEARPRQTDSYFGGESSSQETLAPSEAPFVRYGSRCCFPCSSFPENVLNPADFEVQSTRSGDKTPVLSSVDWLVWDSGRLPGTCRGISASLHSLGKKSSRHKEVIRYSDPVCDGDTDLWRHETGGDHKTASSCSLREKINLHVHSSDSSLDSLVDFKLLTIGECCVEGK